MFSYLSRKAGALGAPLLFKRGAEPIAMFVFPDYIFSLIIFLLPGGILLLVLLKSMIVVVPQGYAYVVETLGRYSATWEAGLHFKLPFFQKVVRSVSLKEQVADFPPQPCISQENATIMINPVAFFKVFDPKLFVYGAEEPITALGNLTATTLRNIIGSLTIDQTLTSRDTINAQMQTILDKATDPWGLRITRCELKDISVSPDVAEAMEKQLKAERTRRATITEAEAHKQAVVTRAEGDKQAKIFAAEAERDAQIAIAEGRARSIELLYEAEARGIELLNKANISNGVLKLKGLEALKNVADGQATKIYMPNDLASVIASLGVVGDSLGLKPAENVAAKAYSADVKD